MKISFTYEVITDESTVEGDFADHGFYDPSGGWKYSMNNPETKKDIKENSHDYDYSGGLVQAIKEAQNLGCREPSDGLPSNSATRISFRSVDPDRDYSTGEETYYSVHFSGISPKTLMRICREFGLQIKT